MIKGFLLKLQQRKKLRKLQQIEQELRKREMARMEILDTFYEITEVELEVLRQGNKKLYIQYLKRDRTLKIKKKLDRVLNNTEINRLNEVLSNIYLEETDGKLYFVTYISLRKICGFDHMKNSIEVFKRKAGIVQGIIWS